MDCAKSWGGVSTCNTGTEHRSGISVTSKVLHFYTAFYSAGDFSSLKRCKRRSHLSGKRGT